MKRVILLFAVLVIASVTYASDAWRVYIDGSNNVIGAQRSTSLSDPTPLRDNEVRFHAEYVFPTNAMHHWKYDGTDIVAMTSAEADAVDAARSQALRDRKDAQTQAMAADAQTRAILKTIADITGDDLTNVVARYKFHYRREID